MKYASLKTRIQRLQPEGEPEIYCFWEPEEAEKFKQKLIRERGEAGIEGVLILILPSPPLAARHSIE